LFYITSGASQAVPESACVEANRTACVELYCSSKINDNNEDPSEDNKTKRMRSQKKSKN
jgi:hypothetical protein